MKPLQTACTSKAGQSRAPSLACRMQAVLGNTMSGVVVAQAAFTFLGQLTSTLFGQNLLASMREFVVDRILGLPLSRVEAGSTGDLVTRVTRDVGTMSRAVQFGLPMAVITLLTVVLSVAAMLRRHLRDHGAMFTLASGLAMGTITAALVNAMFQFKAPNHHEAVENVN